MNAVAERPAPRATLSYALRWRVSGVVPGAHAGTDSGQSGRFRQSVPFDRSPDPRRIDLRASARDPFGGLFVRQFEQRVSATVEALVDLSASMAFDGMHGRAQRVVTALTALADATHDAHDSFGVSAGAERVEWRQPARRSQARALIERLSTIKPRGQSIAALQDVAASLGRRRRLVFVFSDFDFDLTVAARLFDALDAHDVVPVCIGESLAQRLPPWGIVELQDMESGRRRPVLLRPAMRKRWIEAEQARRADLTRLCATRGRRPFFLDGEFDAEALSNHLLEA